MCVKPIFKSLCFFLTTKAFECEQELSRAAEMSEWLTALIKVACEGSHYTNITPFFCCSPRAGGDRIP